jgi:hypothetical protein
MRSDETRYSRSDCEAVSEKSDTMQPPPPKSRLTTFEQNMYNVANSGVEKREELTAEGCRY